MVAIGFIGLGHMGAPMAHNLLKAGYRVNAYDLSPTALQTVAAHGAEIKTSIAAAVADVDIVISMLPAGQHVKTVYLDANGVLASAKPGALLLECSTIDVETAQSVHQQAAAKGFAMLDAPVSGGTAGAEAATLTFMVGGDNAAFDRALPILSLMGKNIFHVGGAGHGQGAKICNNMLLGISMIGVAEAFKLGEKLGLDSQALFEVISKASGQCWSLTSYCPVPGPVPSSPANRDYQPGFTTAMMLKDLRLAAQTAQQVSAATPLGNNALSLYTLFANSGHEQMDFSGIITLLK